jgi:hypothetical protein
VNGERAAEFLGFFVERPVDFVSQVTLDGFAIGRQHAAEHAQFFNCSAQFSNARANILKRDERDAFEPRILLEKFFVKPVVVSFARDEEIAAYMPQGNQMAKLFPEFDHLHFRYLKQNRRATGNPSPQA